MLFYDGQVPTGFKNSEYRVPNESWSPSDHKVDNLFTLIRQTATNSDVFNDLLAQNKNLLFKWF